MATLPILTPSAERFLIESEPYYQTVGSEKTIFHAAYESRIPVLLKGPTGCGKTRFVHHMAHVLGRPLISVSCHEDLSASDLIGRYLMRGDEIFWSDGPMTAAVRMGAILYLDEVVEARKDTIVSIHALTDHRRTLSIDKLASVLAAPPEFMLIISYNPGYQSLLKELKPSTKQRFISISFDYPSSEIEQQIIEKESLVSSNVAHALAKFAQKIRNLRHHGLHEGVSTRLLIHAARLIKKNIPPKIACHAAFTQTLSEDPELSHAIDQLISDFF